MLATPRRTASPMAMTNLNVFFRFSPVLSFNLSKTAGGAPLIASMLQSKPSAVSTFIAIFLSSSSSARYSLVG